MALTLANRGTGTHNSSALSFTLSPGTDFSAQGSMAVLCIAADNSASGGSTNNFTTVTDTLGNTWTKRQFPVFDNGAANNGVQGAIYTTPQDAGKLVTGTVITVSFGANTVAKTWTLTEVVQNGSETIAFRTGGNKSAGATSASCTLGASATVYVGEAIIACFYLESGITQSIFTPDSDTTNGTWSTNQYAEIGTTTSGSCIVSQGKVQTTTNSTQSYDVTLGISSDYHGSYVILHSIVDTPVEPGTTGLTITPFTPTVAVNNNVTVVPNTATLTAAMYVPTVAVTANVLVVPETASAAIATFVPTVAVTDNVTVIPETASIVTSTFVATVVITSNVFVTPDTASATITAYVPSVIQGLIVVPGTASLALESYVPTVEATGGGTLVTPETASVAITCYVPTVAATSNVMIVPETAALAATAYGPTVAVSDHITVIPETASLTITSYVPAVALSDNMMVVPETASLASTCYVPSVVVTENAFVVPETASLTAACYAPTVAATDNKMIVPETASLVTELFIPDVAVSAYALVVPETASLAVTLYAPTVTAGEDKLVTPETASLILACYAATVSRSVQRHNIKGFEDGNGTVLTFGVIEDGQTLKRVGNVIVGV